MDDLTLTEWCLEQGLTDKEIDFITSFMTFQSMITYGTYDSTKVLQRLKSEYPQYKIDIKKNYDNFELFNELIKMNMDVDAQELLHKFCEQNLCKPLAKKILQTKQ